MCVPELQWLFEKAGQMQSIVEIGSWMGKTTHALCSGCPGIVIAVDHFKGCPNERDGPHIEATQRDISQDFWRNVGHFKNLSLLKMDSVKAAGLFRPKTIDMGFIDASHEYPDIKADLSAWLPVCRKLICGHDIGYPSVRQAVEESGKPYSVIGSNWSMEL
jgi:predicted O-methyltransferase YrrM